MPCLVRAQKKGNRTNDPRQLAQVSRLSSRTTRAAALFMAQIVRRFIFSTTVVRGRGSPGIRFEACKLRMCAGVIAFLNRRTISISISISRTHPKTSAPLMAFECLVCPHELTPPVFGEGGVFYRQSQPSWGAFCGPDRSGRRFCSLADRNSKRCVSQGPIGKT